MMDFQFTAVEDLFLQMDYSFCCKAVIEASSKMSRVSALHSGVVVSLTTRRCWFKSQHVEFACSPCGFSPGSPVQKTCFIGSFVALNCPLGVTVWPYDCLPHPHPTVAGLDPATL